VVMQQRLDQLKTIVPVIPVRTILLHICVIYLKPMNWPRSRWQRFIIYILWTNSWLSIEEKFWTIRF